MVPPAAGCLTVRAGAQQRTAIALFLLLAALIIRSASLPGRSWWIDELIARDVARLPLYNSDSFDQQRPPFTSILAFCRHDSGPGPAAYLLDGFFAAKAEPMGGEFWMRLPPIVAAILTLLLLMAYGRHIAGSPAGAIVMAAGYAIMPAMVDYGTTPRGYAWAVLLGFLHLTALVRGALSARRRRGRVAWAWWIVAAFSGITVALVNVVSLVWVSACLMSAATDHGAAGRAARCGVVSVGFAIGVAAALWFALWLQGLAATPNTLPASRGALDAVSQLLNAVRELHHDGTTALLALTALLMVTGRRCTRRKPPVPVRAVWLALAFSGILAVVFAYKFFLAPRHLFPAQMAFLLLLGLSTRPALRCLSQRIGERFACRVLATGVCLIAIAAFPFALRQATIPMHDWRSAIRQLAADYQAGDLILCGPNSDLEIVRAYAGAAGIPAEAVPRWIDAGDGRLLPSASEEGLAAALASDGRIWFVTGFYGQVRPASYWALVERHFQKIRTTTTGRLPIMLLARKMPDKSL